MDKTTRDVDTEEKAKFIKKIHTARKSENKYVLEFSQLVTKDFTAFSENFRGNKGLLALQAIQKRVERLADFSFVETKTLGAIGGGFSAGKSAFINSFISEYLLAEDNDPTTAIPSYVCYGNKVSITGISKNGGTFPIEKSEYQKIDRAFVESFRNTFGYSVQEDIPCISVRCSMDQSLFGDICLIDTPGYNPGGHFSQKDFETAQEYIKNAEFLIWAVSLENGTIPADDIKFLNTLIEKRETPYRLYILASQADKQADEVIAKRLDKYEKDLQRVHAKYYGISAYSSKHKKEVAFRLMSIKDFVRQNNNPSGKIAELYDEINRIFDDYVKKLKDEKAVNKKLRGAANEVHLKAMKTNYAKNGTGDGENTEAISKLKQVISSTIGRIDFDHALKDAETLRTQFLTCLDNLCIQFNITKKIAASPVVPGLTGNINQVKAAPKKGKKQRKKKIRLPLLLKIVFILLIGFACYYSFFSIGKGTKAHANSPANAPAQIVDNPGHLTAAPEIEPEPVDPFPGFIRITGGTFLMGSPEIEEGHEDDEAQHTVTLDDFYIGEKEVTLAEFKAFVKETEFQTLPELNAIGIVEYNGEMIVRNDATYLKPYIYQDGNHPVVVVSWYDAIEYCNWRSQRENLKPVYKIDGDTVEWDTSGNGYRLPTEAEWEYACRAGSDGPYYADFSDFIASPEGTKDVKSSSANSWGLYDLHTNVSEWCWDVYADIQDDTSIASRAVRGGNWAASALQARSAYRSSGNPKLGSNITGFRLALSVKEKGN